jgi:hypothetical protein
VIVRFRPKTESYGKSTISNITDANIVPCSYAETTPVFTNSSTAPAVRCVCSIVRAKHHLKFLLELRDGFPRMSG